MRGRHTLAALCGVLCLLVSACGGSAKSQPLPRPTASLSPSASPTPPVMPAAAKEKTKAGAIAFARHYVDLINHAQATGDVSPLAAAERPDCTSCQRSRSAVTQLYESGATVDGGDWTIEGADALKNQGSGGWLIEMHVSFGPQQVDRPGSSSDQQLKGGRLPVNVQLVWEGDAWKVAECTRGA
jgi:hypothetical protein